MSALTARRIALSLFTIGALALFGLAPASAAPAAPKPAEVSAAERARLTESFGKLPLYFIENRGQLDKTVSHYLQGRDKSIYFTPQGVTFVLYPPTAMLDKKHERLASDAQPIERQPIERHVVKLDFLNANPDVKPQGHNKTAALISYFKGKPSDQHAAIPTWLGVTYANLWDGIDLAYDSAESSLKYTFTVRPHADPSLIQLAYRGADSVTLTDAGALTVSTPGGSLYDGSPIAWQDIAGQRIAVPVSFTLEAATHAISFALGDYDKSQPLTLDPAYLVYAGYIGGSLSDWALGIAVDASGNAYVTGRTGSSPSGLPVVAGPDLTYNGSTDAFVAKVNAAGTALVYLGYIGGSGFDVGRDIAVDTAGNAYVTGETWSSESSFPVLVGPDVSFGNNWSDAFVAKVNAAGTALIYCGYIGGSGVESGNGIAVDAAGNAYIAGVSDSDAFSLFPFPAVGGLDPTHNGGYDDAFVAKVNASGSGLVYAGFIGGDGADIGRGIAVDSAGNAYVTGSTDSTQASFPDLVGPYLSFKGGLRDGFVAKVNAAGSALVYAGYLGGNGADYGNAIAVDSAGNAYVTGSTDSTSGTFPVLGGPDLTYNGFEDAFVSKINATGSALVYSGFIGGSGFDRGFGIAVDSFGRAYVAGNTSSLESSFPEIGGPDLSYNGNGDAFVARLNASGSAIQYVGYIGGMGSDTAFAIALDGVGNAYVTGSTNSSEASFPETRGPDLTYNGSDEAFVAKIGTEPTAPSALTAAAISSSRIALGWGDRSTNEAGFKLERKLGLCASTNTWSQIALVVTNIISYTNTGLPASTAYSYRVRAYNAGGNSGYSNCASAATGLAGTPNSPTTLRATSISASQINLTWADTSTDEMSFKLFRRVGTGSWALLATKAANAVGHSDTTATGNTSTTLYSYYMQACNSAGCSPATTVSVVPYRPTTLAASPVSASQINLTWTDTSTNETGFQIYRKAGNCATVSSWSLIATKAANSTSHSNAGLPSGTTYAYLVKSFTRSLAVPYAHGFSLSTACASATTQ